MKQVHTLPFFVCLRPCACNDGYSFFISKANLFAAYECRRTAIAQPTAPGSSGWRSNNHHTPIGFNPCPLNRAGDAVIPRMGGVQQAVFLSRAGWVSDRLQLLNSGLKAGEALASAPQWSASYPPELLPLHFPVGPLPVARKHNGRSTARRPGPRAAYVPRRLCAPGDMTVLDSRWSDWQQTRMLSCYLTIRLCSMNIE